MLPAHNLPPILRPAVAQPTGPAASPAVGGSPAAPLPNLAQLRNATLHARPDASGLTARDFESGVVRALVQESGAEEPA